jgi:probable rRNA maturation factor
MHLTFVRAPGCRLPSGTREPLAALAARLEPAALAVHVVVGGDRLLARLNREFRARDRATDVLSFRYESRPGKSPQDPDAEVYVSLQRAAAQARQRGHGLAAEFLLLVLHGLLHVQGHDHEAPHQARRMRAAERDQLRWLARRWPRLTLQPLLTAPES